MADFVTCNDCGFIDWDDYEGCWMCGFTNESRPLDDDMVAADGVDPDCRGKNGD